MSELSFDDLPLVFRVSAKSRKGGTLLELTNALWDGNEPRIDASHRAAMLLGDYRDAGILVHADGGWRKK